ncbi:GFA family protein [Tsuneonella suprasediminis]|uniref:GFA family protein n=1 Tax=Tsuneonella suprasediminis TaxID=2306996 RepID=UPI002F9545A8
MSESEIIEGGCNCRHARYKLHGAPLAVAACHCRNCQRQSGSAYSVNLVVAGDSVAIEGELACYEDPDSESGKPVLREFCPNCGSPIRSIPTASPAMVAIKAGTLDNPDAFPPAIHIWTCQMLDWVDVPEGVPQFPKGPQRA